MSTHLRKLLDETFGESLPNYNTVNLQGYKAYALSDEIRLLGVLNTWKLEPQFYKDEHTQLKELRGLIQAIASKDPYYVARMIVWSRCCGEGLRTINHLAAAMLAPYISGYDWSERFFSSFDISTQKGGCIYRLDDMSAIKDACTALNKCVLTNAMKRGFAKTLEKADTYTLAKYKKTTIDISNLTHPKVNKCTATITIKDKEYKTIDAIMKGLPVIADTWEAANTEAGQRISKAIKYGKISVEKGQKMLKKAKNDNWKSLLKERKLNILAAIRNIRNIAQVGDKETLSLLCDLVSNGKTGKSNAISIGVSHDFYCREFIIYRNT